MVNKKYLLLAGLFSTALMQPAFAQESGNGTAGSATYQRRDMTYRGESYDVLDSSVVPGRRMDQHRQYLNHQYNFPAKPRNMVEIGFSAGIYNYSGDVSSTFPWQKSLGNVGGYGFGLHIRKALGYVFSVRADYNYGIAQGLNFQPSSGYTRNTPWMSAYALPTNVFYNYRSEAHQLNLDLVASFGNLLFHKARTKVDPYVFLGVGGNAYQTWVNALNNSYQAYDYSPIFNNPAFSTANGGFNSKNRKEIKKQLSDIMDDTYESSAQSDAAVRRPEIFGHKKLSFVSTFGAGVQFRLSRRINLALEDRVTFFPTTNEDLLDGQRWDEGNGGGPTVSQSKDGINYASVGLNFNVGGSSRNVEPLYWLNPLDYAYGELSNPRHMILPEPILPDADGDGIADQFDKCPGTPAGVAVDSHGCPMDTDGDGVPDDRDKQLITPTECQPVDADGVGKCPCNCTGVVGTCSTTIGSGTLTFPSGSSRITPAMQSQLATLAAAMAASPNCRVVVMGNPGDSKAEQQRSWDRVNAVIEYMSEKNSVDRNRFIFKYDGGAPANSVMYRSAMEGENGESNIPPPHPNLRRD